MNYSDDFDDDVDGEVENADSTRYNGFISQEIAK
jgi:hypothetical protein